MSKTKEFVALTNCFYCGQPDKLLIHKQMQDISDLHGKVTDKEPCPKCKALMEQGILFIETKDGETGSNPYRTGRQWVLRDEFVTRNVQPDSLRDSILKARVTFIEQSVAASIGFPQEGTPQ